MRRSDWHDPDAGKVPFGEYAAAWIKERELTTTTRQLYGSLLWHHLEPTFGALNVAEISPPLVRRWRADKLAGVPARPPCPRPTPCFAQSWVRPLLTC